jgi:hypothetical protein
MIGRVKGSRYKASEREGNPRPCLANGYGAFSVSESSVEAVTAYITANFSYQGELRELLKRHRVAFDERFLWE